MRVILRDKCELVFRTNWTRLTKLCWARWRPFGSYYWYHGTFFGQVRSKETLICLNLLLFKNRSERSLKCTKRIFWSEKCLPGRSTYTVLIFEIEGRALPTAPLIFHTSPVSDGTLHWRFMFYSGAYELTARLKRCAGHSVVNHYYNPRKWNHDADENAFIWKSTNFLNELYEQSVLSNSWRTVVRAHKIMIQFQNNIAEFASVWDSRAGLLWSEFGNAAPLHNIAELASVQNSRLGCCGSRSGIQHIDEGGWLLTEFQVCLRPKSRIQVY